LPVLADSALHGKNALVIGAGGSNGRAIALGLAEAGANVSLVARKPGEIEAAAAEVRALGREALTFTGTNTDSERIEQIVADTWYAFGRIDILCNHAGLSARNVIADTTDEAWDACIRANLYGPFIATRAVARRLIEAGSGGAIINTTSTASVSTLPNLTAYSTAKAALSHFTRGAAAELAPDGIRVNAIMLGMFKNAGDRLAGTPLHDFIFSVTPMKRWGEPPDAAAAVVFLASDASAYITGEILRVTGGAWLVG
jgi:NAD(P)-dependent dehydrogenase (short-subunit alcohol dehydrogenase family)